MILSIVALIAVLANQPQLLQWDKLLTIFNMIFGTCILYSSIFIVRAGICFYTTQGLEIMNIFTDGVRDLTQYPLDIYGETVKKIFTFVIPAALVNYYPFIYLIGRDTNIINMFCPLFVVILLIPSLIFWKIGVRKYRSVGS
jgi:ABC-2 type transport system permease protein